jgi:hypothetical protein
MWSHIGEIGVERERKTEGLDARTHALSVAATHCRTGGLSSPAGARLSARSHTSPSQNVRPRGQLDAQRSHNRPPSLRRASATRRHASRAWMPSPPTAAARTSLTPPPVPPAPPSPARPQRSKWRSRPPGVSFGASVWGARSGLFAEGRRGRGSACPWRSAPRAAPCAR